MSFIRHADVVKIANIAQIVNVIAPVMTRGDEILLQTIYEALAMFVDRRLGNSLRVGYEGPMLSSPDFSEIDMITGDQHFECRLTSLRICGQPVNRSGRRPRD